MKGRDNLCGKFQCCLKKLPEPLQTSATTISDQSASINIKAKPSTSKKIATH